MIVKTNCCKAEWQGANTAHCASCHETFTTVSAFDKHRKGAYEPDNRHCVHPITVGLVEAGRMYPCWAHPGTKPLERISA